MNVDDRSRKVLKTAAAVGVVRGLAELLAFACGWFCRSGESAPRASGWTTAACAWRCGSSRGGGPLCWSRSTARALTWVIEAPALVVEQQ